MHRRALSADGVVIGTVGCPGRDRLGEDTRYWLDSSAIHKDVGWQPRIRLEDGIREMVEWGRAYLDQLRAWPTDYTLRA